MNERAQLSEKIEKIIVWQCIGCGRIEGPQPCVGVCQDKKVALVSGEAYDAVATRLRDSEARLAALEGLATRLALAQPRNGAWEKSYRALQVEARRTLREGRAVEPSSTSTSRERFVEP